MIKRKEYYLMKLRSREQSSEGKGEIEISDAKRMMMKKKKKNPEHQSSDAKRMMRKKKNSEACVR